MICYDVTTDRWSSVVEMKYTDLKGKLFEERRVFLNPKEVQVYLAKHLEKYIFTKLKGYIMHCWIISKNSHHQAYSQEERANANKYLQDQVRSLKDYNVLGLARWILRNQDFLEKVLPHFKNASFHSSKRTIDELIRLSKELFPDDWRRG